MTRRFARAALAALLAATAGAAAAGASERYDPALRFHRLRTAHFTIYFHQGLEPLARRLAVVAEEVHRDLAARFDAVDPGRHTHVILADQHDEANGWATPLPYDTIEITAAAPDPASLIGHTDDWLRLVFAHEYTHILHLDRSRGFFRALRALFGRAPMAFPNLYLPAWNVEGLATSMETVHTGAGRLLAGDFRTLVDAAARAGRFEPIDRAGGGLAAWPAGHAAYAYGARFHEFLADRYGPGRIAELADATAGRAPYFSGGAYRRVFGAGPRELWRQFERAVQASAGRPAASAAGLTRLTAHGFVTAGPRWTPDGRSLVYSVRDPHGFPALMEIPAGGGAPARVADRYLGERTWAGERTLVFDQRELKRSVALQSDLYLLDRGTRRVHRLTRHARASDPDVRPSDGSIVAVARREGRADLVRYTLSRQGDRWRAATEGTLAGAPHADHAAPRWSPDGLRVAAARRTLGQLPDVVVIEAATGRTVARVAAAEGRVGDPEWTPDGRALILAWERPGDPFNLYRVDLDDGAVREVVRLPGGARAPAVSPDGRRVAFIGYTAEGYDLFVADANAGEAAPPGLSLVRDAGIEQGRLAAAQPAGGTGPAVSDAEVDAYRPWPTLLPRFWMPLVAADDERVEVGAGTAGADVLGRHAYAATIAWSGRARPDWSAVYAYDRWRPTLFVAAADDGFEWQQTDVRETTVDAGLRLSFRTTRRAQTFLAALHATRERSPQSVFDRRSLRLGYQVTTARRYGYSISPEGGIAAGVAVDLTRRALGADASGGAATADVRAYAGVGGRHRVLALRAAAGISWGDLAARRVLGAGGASAGPLVSFDRDAVGLARGFRGDDIAGDKAIALSADYRIPLAAIERGPGTWPLFVRQVHAAVFVDAAHAWVRRFDAADLRVSGGIEIAADAVLGHALPLTAAAGVAARRDPLGGGGAAAFARVGYAF